MIAIVLLILGCRPIAAAAAPLAQLCPTSGNYTSTSIYKANLRLLSGTLPKTTTAAQTHVANGSAGAAPDTAYGFAQCHHDGFNASACQDCVAGAFQDAEQLCGLSKDASLLYGLCILHLSHRSFSYRADGVLSRLLVMADPSLPGWHPGNANSIDVLLQEMANLTAYNSTLRFVTGRMDINTFPPIYSLTKCTPDLPPAECSNCLHHIAGVAKTYLTATQGGFFASVWCSLRYSTYQFYQGQPMRHIDSTGAEIQGAYAPAPAPATLPNAKHNSWTIKVVLIATTISLLVLFLFFILAIAMVRRHRKGKVTIQEEEAQLWGIEGSSEFTFFKFSLLSDATNNFADENKLGKGGFGPVYKGQLPDGFEIAIMRLASHSGQGLTEFRNEIQLIAKLQHRNLVRLLGCCSQGDEKILIHEYLPNKSLDFFIFDEGRRTLLNWNRSLAIIEGVAHGLLYLHKHSRLRVIHRDLKASNILLDNEMNPKISDFGLANIFCSNGTHGTTRTIAGTYGYMAPEYASKGFFSVKSDVFSFGVLILEIISGTRNFGFHQSEEFFDLLGYAWKLWLEKRWLALAHKSLVSEIQASGTMRCVNIALLCVQDDATDRPTMSDVVAMLGSDSMTLPEPKHPAYFHTPATKEDEPSSVNDVTLSVLRGR